jgi:phosphohistidine phosphatase
MKTLYLVRHAKSSWNDPSMLDYERPLDDRGNSDKKTMAIRLKEKEIRIDYLLSSSAKRTTQTTYGLLKELTLDSQQVEFTKALYHASASDMLNEINKVSDMGSNLMLVGHNPGISNLCDYLCDYLTDFPTLGIAKIVFNLESWQEISRGSGTLEWFDYPKNGLV